MSLQEFVNRGYIKNRFNENTFRKYITILIKKGYVDIVRKKFGVFYKITLFGDKRAKELLKDYNKDLNKQHDQLLKKSEFDIVDRLKNDILGQFNPLYEQTVRNYEVIRNVRAKYLDHLPLLHELLQKPEDNIEIDENEALLKEIVIEKYEIFTSALKKYYKNTFRDFLRKSNISKHENIKDSLSEYNEMLNRIDKCPGCGSTKIEDYVIMIECQECRNEYFKKDIREIEDKSDILSIQEKTHFLDAIFLDFID